jgi:hypothetical protein
VASPEFWQLLTLPGSSPVLAYGPAPGVELIPYFLGLVAWAGVAFATVLLWPLTALLRRFRAARHGTETGPPRQTLTPSAPESSGQGSHDTV